MRPRRTSCKVWSGLSRTRPAVPRLLAAGSTGGFRVKYDGNCFAYWGQGYSSVERESEPDLSYYIQQAPRSPVESVSMQTRISVRGGIGEVMG